jgi:hypothetical protein
MKNRAYLEVIKCCPYEAMSLMPSKACLKSPSIPPVFVSEISTEELPKVVHKYRVGDEEDEGGERENSVVLSSSSNSSNNYYRRCCNVDLNCIEQ